MKTRITIIVLLAVLVSACGTTVTGGTNIRSVSVNGSGAVSLSPDMATINIGVSTQDADAQRALDKNNAQAEAIRETLAEFGVAEDDIKTTNFSIWPRQDYDRDGEVTDIYYVVSNTVLVTVRDLEQLGDILDAVVGSGANQVNGINFDVADRESAYQVALEAAMDNAYARASALAGAADVSLGEVQSINTFVSGGGPIVQFERMAMDMAAAESVPVSGGTMEITVEVSVVYELK